MSRDPEKLPEVPIWKRGQRLAEVARDFALLFDSARNAADESRRPRAESAARIGRRIEREAREMADLLERIAAEPLVPKVPPTRYWQDKEDDR